MLYVIICVIIHNTHILQNVCTLPLIENEGINNDGNIEESIELLQVKYYNNSFSYYLFSFFLAS